MLSLSKYCIKKGYKITTRKSQDKIMIEYNKYKYEMCKLNMFINKLYNYEPDLINNIKYLVTNSYKWKPITNTQIPLIKEIFITPHISDCYASYHGSDYFINCYNNYTTGNVSCNRCKIQKDYEFEYGEPKYWIMNDVTEKLIIHTNNNIELKKLTKKLGYEQ